MLGNCLRLAWLLGAIFSSLASPYGNIGKSTRTGCFGARLIPWTLPPRRGIGLCVRVACILNAVWLLVVDRAV